MPTTIITSDHNLRFHDRAYPGCPLLLVDGRLEPAPSLWLFWVFRNRAVQTSTAYAQAIELWFRALATTGIAWWEATPTDLEAFQTLMGHGGAAADTVRLRSIAVSQFYRWCHDNGLIARIPFVARASRSPRTNARPGTTVGLPVAARRSVRSHSADQFDRILGGIERKTPGLLRRDELICEAARYLGLRRSEVVGLTVKQFLCLDSEEAVLPILLRSETTKGGKERAVLAPRLFVQKVQRYIAGYRAELADDLVRRQPRYRDPGALFLNERGKRAGQSVDPAYVTRTWKEAAKAVGVDSRFHNNRASLATSAADRAIAHGEIPVVIVKSLLGHSREETTLRYIEQAQLKNHLLIQAKIVNDYYSESEAP